MAYVDVPDPFLDVNKPGRSADWKQIRDNIRYLKAITDGIGVGTDQDIHDHFAASAFSTVNWVSTIAGAGANTIISQHTAELDTNGNGTGDYAVLTATTAKMRIVKTEEYVAFMEARMRQSGQLPASYFVGWNDNALAAASTFASDVTDCVGITFDTGTAGWIARTAETAGGTSTYSITTDSAVWHTYRLQFTCSATAGSRKLEVYFDGALVQTLATDANIPAEILCPGAGVRGNAGGANVSSRIEADYIMFGFLTTPTAA